MACHRQDGAPAQSSPAGPGQRPCGRGLRRAAAARHAVTSRAARAGSRFQPGCSGMSRNLDPACRRRVRRVPGCLRARARIAGKGIYDVDLFEAAVAGRVLNSTLLSHDLFEGVFARAGLASDVEVIDEFPARYDIAALRHHRWARGDWQLLPWILGRGPIVSEKMEACAISRRSAAGEWSTICDVRCRLQRLSSPCWSDGPCRLRQRRFGLSFVFVTAR